MGKKDKLYRKAKESPENFSFTEICSLAEHVGFEFRNQSGSHKIYKHPKIDELVKSQIRRMCHFDRREKSYLFNRLQNKDFSFHSK